MRLIFWLVAVPLLLLTAFFVVSNRGEVSVGLWPLTQGIQLPLWGLILASLYVGFVIGAVAAWAAGHRHRARARAAMADVRQLEVELERARAAAARAAATPSAVPPSRQPALPAMAGSR